MHIGMVGLGKMGKNMRTRLERAGIEVTGYDTNPEVSDVDSLESLVAAIPEEKHIWVMVPSGDVTQRVIDQLGELLNEGDLVCDGGNSLFTDDRKHCDELAARGIEYIDCGVSGGIWGLDEGYGLMAGGDAKNIERMMPVFDALRPEGDRSEGFCHTGDVGAGHYAKMVHNGIEYGLMHAYAEGYQLLQAKDIVADVHGCFKAWSKGTVVRSWLLDLMVKALDETTDLEGVSGYTEDSGEGRWTLIEGVRESVPMPVLASALFARFSSRDRNSAAMQAVAALRGQFGGHEVMQTGDEPWQ